MGAQADSQGTRWITLMMWVIVAAVFVLGLWANSDPQALPDARRSITPTEQEYLHCVADQMRGMGLFPQTADQYQASVDRARELCRQA